VTTDKDRRARENADLIRRMKAGETLSLVAPAATWWPPRALIKKDPGEVARVYGDVTHGTVVIYPISQAGYAALKSSLDNSEPRTPAIPE